MYNLMEEEGCAKDSVATEQVLGSGPLPDRGVPRQEAENLNLSAHSTSSLKMGCLTLYTELHPVPRSRHPSEHYRGVVRGMGGDEQCRHSSSHPARRGSFGPEVDGFSVQKLPLM